MEFRRVGRREGRPLEGPFHQGTFHAGSALPPHDTAGAKIHFGSQIVPSFAGGQIGDVGHPCLLGGYQGNSLSAQETIRGDRVIMAALGGAGSIASLSQGAQPTDGHEPGDAPPSTGAASSIKNHAQAAGAIGAPTFPKGNVDARFQIGILPTTQSFGFVAMCVVAATTDFQCHAELFYRVMLLFHRFNQREAFHSSWPKMLQAFFKMSRCRLTVSNSRLSRRTSVMGSRAPVASGAVPPPPVGPPPEAIFR